MMLRDEELADSASVARARRRRALLQLSALALLVGAIAGHAALAFQLAVDMVGSLVWGGPEEAAPLVSTDLPVLYILMAPVLGGLLLGLALRFVLPGPLPQGVAEVIEAAALRRSRMGLREGLSAALLSAGSLGLGASVGREGPIIHLGAALASVIGRRLDLGPRAARMLLACGSAAAIAAMFNTPIAGVFFALEVVVGGWAPAAFSSVAIASAMGTIVTRVYIGDNPSFDVPAQMLTSMLEVPAFALLGVGCGLLSVALMRSIMLVQDVHERLRLPLWARPAIAGLGLGVAALYLPLALGTGFVAADAVLHGELLLQTVILLALAKGVTTALSLGSSFGGGIVSPSLSLGALVGGAFGMVAAAIAPELGSAASVYAMVGMGALTAAMLGAPVSTAVMIFELTGDQAVTLVVMIGVAASMITSRSYTRYSFFTLQLARRGIELTDHRPGNI
jgi:chloride channel protein, CIC family